MMLQRGEYRVCMVLVDTFSFPLKKLVLSLARPVDVLIIPCLLVCCAV